MSEPEPTGTGYKAIEAAAADVLAGVGLTLTTGLPADGSHVRLFFTDDQGREVFVYDIPTNGVLSFARHLIQVAHEGKRRAHEIEAGLPIQRPPKGKVV